MSVKTRVLALAALLALADCGMGKGISSRMASGAKPGSDPLCQVYQGGGGLRPGSAVVISMRVANDRSCSWGFNANGFGGVTQLRSAAHGTSLVEGGRGPLVYQYRATPGYVGSDSFTFNLSRGDGYDNPINVDVEVVAAP